MTEARVPYVVTQEMPHKPPLLFWKAYSSDMTEDEARAAYCEAYDKDPASVQVQTLNIRMVGPCDPIMPWDEVKAEDGK